MKYSLFLVFIFFLGSSCSKPQGKKFTIGFSQCTGADQWRQTMLSDMKRALSFHPDYTLLYEDAGNSTEKQIAQIQSLTSRGIDLLIISPNETAPITKAVNAVFKQGIPVIVLDRRIDSESYNAYIGGDNFEIGRLAGAFIGNHLKGKGAVIEVKGLAGSSPAQERHRGLQQQLTRFPGIRVVAELDGEWERDTARHRAEANLAALQRADLVFAHNDVMALGVYEVCKQHGLTSQIEFVGIDALPGPQGGMQLVTDGLLKASFLYPTGGEEAIETAVQVLAGKAVRRETTLNSIQIDASNVQAIKAQSDKLLSQQQDIEKQSQRIDELKQTYLTQRNTLYVTLASLFVVILLGAWALYLVRQKQTAYQILAKQNVEISEQKDRIEAVSAQARLATEEKLRFYSYISHEFNTPLNLILTPAEDLLAKKTVNPYELKANLSLIRKNAYRLLRLVDQMLDLRKTDAGKLLLQAGEQDLVAFIRDIVSDFRRKAEKNHIDLQFIPAQSMLMVWFDREKLDKVLFNLLSNAFKYTSKGGLIHVRVDLCDNRARIQVQDNGAGMNAEEQAHAFDLFYTAPKHFNLGNGVGLALSREFVHLHYGEIDVRSEKEQGTTFTILLPLGNAHLDPTQQEEIPGTRTLPLLLEDDEVTLTPATTNAQVSRKTGTLVLIEDHDELRQYLTTRLSEEFDVVAESTAEKGWETVLETVPDLIISDVMLPGMDGLQLTQRVKSDFRTSTIPVILLTAKGQMENRIEGTRAGADAYIAKPFLIAYLLETIRTALNNREKWQKRYMGDYLTKTENRQEKKFLNELTTLIEQNLADPSFGVEQLSREMGVSRVQLYRKVQALLDKNVNEYFTEIRLKKAKVLLMETNKAMSEIAGETGFGSPAYFTTFFKQHTKQTPSEYRKSPVGV
jgi:signal transduction histidine kinase/DNA-binding response OmpR family regulator